MLLELSKSLQYTALLARTFKSRDWKRQIDQAHEKMAKDYSDRSDREVYEGVSLLAGFEKDMVISDTSTDVDIDDLRGHCNDVGKLPNYYCTVTVVIATCNRPVTMTLENAPPELARITAQIRCGVIEELSMSQCIRSN